MTSDELKGTVSTILGQQHSAQLYLVLKVNDELVLRLADIEDESTAPEIQHMFEEFLETTIVANEDMIVRNLSVADESTNAVYEYDYDMSMLKTTAISLLGSTSTVPRAEPPTAVPSFSG